MTNINNALKSVRYIVDINGQQVAVILSIKAWNTLNNCIEIPKNAVIVKPSLNTNQAPFSKPRPLNSIEFELEEINISNNYNSCGTGIPARPEMCFI